MQAGVPAYKEPDHAYRRPRAPSRPSMAATYAPGTVRARRWPGNGDMRGYRPPTACADLTDIHPITGRPLPRAVWWLI